jgi:hypothetical protein
VETSQSAVKRGSKALSWPASAEPSEPTSYHIYLKLRDVSYKISEDWEMYFSVYDSLCGQFVSEKFLVKLPRKGDSQFVDSFHQENHGAIFTVRSAFKIYKTEIGKLIGNRKVIDVVVLLLDYKTSTQNLVGR